MKLETKWRRFGAMLAALVLSCFGANLSIAQSPNAKSGETAALNGDRMGELQLAAARKNPLQLRQFLKKMPKGADLHYHLSGGVYAESFIRAAVEDGLCVDTKKLAFPGTTIFSIRSQNSAARILRTRRSGWTRPRRGRRHKTNNTWS